MALFEEEVSPTTPVAPKIGGLADETICSIFTDSLKRVLNYAKTHNEVCMRDHHEVKIEPAQVPSMVNTLAIARFRAAGY